MLGAVRLLMSAKVRFAVVGLGNIAQVAVLPAFQHAKTHCELVALISSDEKKKTLLAERYGVSNVGSYDEMEDVFDKAGVDAAYIALPNAQHRPFAERCARARVHVLCEKPMALTVRDAEAIIHACGANGVKLMVAYRLHFHPSHLRAIELAHSGELGSVKMFSSNFSHLVRAGDIRTQEELGGGALLDMGIYCINASRYLFRDEPHEVFAMQEIGHSSRAHGVDAWTTGLLRFSENRIAQFTSSQVTMDVDHFDLVGTKGHLHVQPAYTYYDEIEHTITIDGKTKKTSFPKSDQFAPELVHFAKCITQDKTPEPSGEEGLADIRIIEALTESARTNRPVPLVPFKRSQRPDGSLEATAPPVRRPKLVNAPPPSK